MKAIEQPLRVPKEFRQRPKLQLYLQKASPATLAAAAVRALKPKGDGPKLPPKNRKGKPKGKLGKAMSAEEKNKKPLHFPLNWFYLFFSRHEQHTHKAATTHAGTCKCNKWVCVIVIVCMLFLFIAYVYIFLRLVQKKTFFAWRHKIRSCIFRQHKNDISSQTFTKVKNKNNATQPQNKLYNFSHVFRMFCAF